MDVACLSIRPVLLAPDGRIPLFCCYLARGISILLAVGAYIASRRLGTVPMFRYLVLLWGALWDGCLCLGVCYNKQLQDQPVLFSSDEVSHIYTSFHSWSCHSPRLSIWPPRT
ncbi:hypothetical protein F4801DRAFT_550173 [Xylaria longipes]|nr:hypothetical protein F4801DRAFT_550173 [Xylaria longipes]